ncbi:MAG: hypothetical protein QOI38_3134 [Sphingomonadales bacterium]|jgi:hypothetical protein|nr:hypothetical protein [Sphingomonadales bacterium]
MDTPPDLSAAKPLIRLFKPGTFTSVEGKTLTYSDTDLQAIADAYDPATDPAPLVVGHPKLTDPAFGWAKELKVVNGELAAVPEKVEPAFAEAVNAGRYAKVSAQFYEPDHPANPKPGAWYLKHIGFLGGAAPAVKGLGTVAFAAEDGPFATVEFTIEEKNMPPKEEDKTAGFAEREAEITRKEADVARREEAAATAIHATHVSFAESLVTAGRLAPAGTALVVGILDVLAAPATVSFAEAGAEAGKVSFGEAEGSDKLSPEAAFRKLFEGTTPLISFGEAAPADRARDKPNLDPADIAERAASFAEEQRQKGRTVTIAAAVRHVMKADKAD